MATRNLKIALASSFSNPSAITNISLDNVLIQNSISINSTVTSPTIIEHTFEATGDHYLKITLENDYNDGTNDLNLIICYIALSNEDGSYTPYTYLIKNESININALDNTLVTETLWGVGDPFEFNFNINSLITFYDYIQYNIDNPPDNIDNPPV
jgi:hypothetical protein